MATELATSLPEPIAVVTLPVPPNEVSSVPSVLYRARAKSRFEPLWLLPTASILPSGWIATDNTSSWLLPIGVVTLPVPPNDVSSKPGGQVGVGDGVGLAPPGFSGKSTALPMCLSSSENTVVDGARDRTVTSSDAASSASDGMPNLANENTTASAVIPNNVAW